MDHIHPSRRIALLLAALLCAMLAAGSVTPVDAADPVLDCPAGTTDLRYCEPSLTPEQFAATGGGESFAACSRAVADGLAARSAQAFGPTRCTFSIPVRCPVRPSGRCRGYVSGSLTGRLKTTDRAVGAASPTLRIKIPLTTFNIRSRRTKRVTITLSRRETRKLRRVKVARGKVKVVTTNLSRPVARTTRLTLRVRPD
jgi:hypothetical protein